MTLQPATYKKLSNFVGIFHWIWIGIMLLGIPAQAMFPWYAPVHWSVIIATGASQIIWGGCPLVTLQNSLRAKYDPTTVYYGSFVYHMLKKFGIQVPPVVIALQMLIFMVISLLVFLVFKIKTL